MFESTSQIYLHRFSKDEAGLPPPSPSRGEGLPFPKGQD